jgi:glycyl-tRNA synthetase beta chain
MVREFTELQGTMGGIYAREEGQPEPVWKAIYYQYLPIGVEADAPPTRAELGTAAVTWAAASLADKLDTVVGLFGVGEKPTGSRDPFGLRRQAHGVLRILIDYPELTGHEARPDVQRLLAKAAESFGGLRALGDEALHGLDVFLRERLRYVLEQRGFDVRNVRAVTSAPLENLRPVDARRKIEVLPEFTESPEFRQLATAFKRVRNIARELPADVYHREELMEQGPRLADVLTEPAERALLAEFQKREAVINDVVTSGRDFRKGFAEAAAFGPTVDRFFIDVFVMADDAVLRTARLRLMRNLEDLILKLADVSEIVPETES